MLKLFKTSVADFPFCKKGGAYAVYRKSLLQTFKLLILGFLSILMNDIYKTRMKRYTDKGSPCLVLLSNLK